MQLYAWSGQRAAALRQYAECERVLDQELGVPPEEETTQLYEAIQARQEWTPSPEMPLEGGVPISTQAHARQQQQPHDLYAPNNLPVQLTPFVGRETELAELDRLLSDPNVRLVTVLGVGGMGKTRLALEAAARQLDQYPHGVYWVSLASLRSVEAIESTVAGALGFTFYSAADSGAATTPRRQLLDYLRYKSLLLLLDSCEPLLEGVDLVSEILQTAPGLRILATSRASLNVQEEYLFHIAGLEYPEPVTQATVETPVDAAIPEGRPEYSAIKLFMQSARRVRPDFAPRADDLEYIARICHLVQGMPLGILLAAAWVEMLSPQEIARELADGEGQGLDFLATDLRNVPERQRSIRTVFDHSWNLLPGRQQAVMEALSVFHGGCTREAAQVVTGASLRDLKSLVDRSLLQRTAAGRYELHQLLRQYAAGRLAGRPAEDEAAHDRHAAYYAQLLHGRAEGRTRIRGSEAMPEIDNARAGWQWAAHKARATWMRDLVYGLVRGYQALGWWREGIAFLQEAIRTLRAVEPGQDRDMALATALAGHAYLLWMIGESEQVPGLFRESQALLRQLDAQEELALCNLWAAWTTVYPDDVRGQLLEESLAIATRIGQPSLASQALRIQAYRAMRDGAYDRAQWCGETALRTSRDAGLRSEMRASWVLLGNVAHLTSDYVKAGQCYQEALALAEKLKNRYSMVALRVDLGDVALAVGEYEQAREHYKDALARYVEASDHRTHARILCGLGDVALAMKDLSSASDQYRRALRLAAEKTDETSCAGAMIGPSALLVQRGEFELAAEVLALVLETNPYPVQARSAAYRLLDALQSELSPALFVAAQERGRARDVRATVEELLGEL
jgi:predicted ATPase/Tfp pilus assembly protein PilF